MTLFTLIILFRNTQWESDWLNNIYSHRWQLTGHNSSFQFDFELDAGQTKLVTNTGTVL